MDNRSAGQPHIQEFHALRRPWTTVLWRQWRLVHLAPGGGRLVEGSVSSARAPGSKPAAFKWCLLLHSTEIPLRLFSNRSQALLLPEELRLRRLTSQLVRNVLVWLFSFLQSHGWKMDSPGRLLKFNNPLWQRTVLGTLAWNARFNGWRWVWILNTPYQI